MGALARSPQPGAAPEDVPELTEANIMGADDATREPEAAQPPNKRKNPPPVLDVTSIQLLHGSFMKVTVRSQTRLKR